MKYAFEGRPIDLGDELVRKEDEIVVTVTGIDYGIDEQGRESIAYTLLDTEHMYRLSFIEIEQQYRREPSGVDRRNRYGRGRRNYD